MSIDENVVKLDEEHWELHIKLVQKRKYFNLQKNQESGVALGG